MILQSIVFPNTRICDRKNMYFRGDRINLFMEDSYCAIPQGESLIANTYFNSFSIGKWKKYTQIDNLSLKLKLKGSCQVYLHHTYTMLGNIKDCVVIEKKVSTTDVKDISISVPELNDNGVYYFEIKAHGSNVELWGGSYETVIDIEKINNVKIAIDICTFKREKYVANNLAVLNEHILRNKKSPLFGKLEIFISDNGKTLSTNLNDERIHIFPNKNVGGAGGFTRGMIEIKNVCEDRGITHILMMDDDICLNPDALCRTYVFLCLLKSEHKDAFIGGHMLKIDSKNIQSEAADHWDMATHHPVKYNYNLEDIKYIVKNEIEDSINYFGWWYCCMPINVVEDNNLPLPIFIKRDDIEYGLRNGSKFITLNGICVWHEPFEYKYATYLEYYYFRNMCIMNSRHRITFNKKRLIKEMRKRIMTFLLRYRYKDAELSLIGIQHYLKGIDWLKQQDGELLNGEIMKLGYKKEPVHNFDHVFTHGIYEKNLNVKQGKKNKICRILSLNGWLLPAKRNVIVPAYQPSTALFYRAKNVLNYEEVSNTAFVTKRDYSSLLYILKMYFCTKKMINKDYDRVTREYRNRYDEITNIGFWNQYLFEVGKKENVNSGLDTQRKPKNNKYQFREIIVSYIFRLIQIALIGLPVKKNRVMVYVHDRKGFTCNPKYIVQELVKEYGDKLEIIWTTMHPETCEEIRRLGISVLKSNSIGQMKKYLRTRVYITNDSFPSWALHRHNQKWINTWHAGMNYKHIGYDYLAPVSSLASRIFKVKNRQPDYYLSGSEFFTKDTAKSFRFNESVFLNTGLPRNDVFFADNQMIVEKVKKHYNIDSNKKLVLFAPTFRRGMKLDTFGMNFEETCKALSERFGGEWILLFRNHNFVKVKKKHRGSIDVSDYHDMQELMCAADVLISDYSSCLFDFCFTHRPAFVYATDLKNYITNDRAFAYPIEKWPFSVAENNEELVKCIYEFNAMDYAEKVRIHLADAKAYDRGNASHQVAELIAGLCF